jgi:hypothetical protein
MIDMAGGSDDDRFGRHTHGYRCGTDDVPALTSGLAKPEERRHCFAQSD